MTLSQQGLVAVAVDKLLERRKIRPSISMQDIKNLMFEFGLSRSMVEQVLFEYYSTTEGLHEIRASGHADKTAYEIVKLLMQSVDRL